MELKVIYLRLEIWCYDQNYEHIDSASVAIGRWRATLIIKADVAPGTHAEKSSGINGDVETRN